jgi:flagellar basal-body rod modification protein FlgD
MATAIQDLFGSTNTATSPIAATSATQIQDRFLTLLVTQLKHQDPLSPMDNAQVTSQLSQISTVSGIDKLNTTMSDLAKAMSSQMTASQAMSNVTMIGREVMAPSNKLNLTDNGATAAVQIDEAAANASVVIYGAAGNVVGKVDMDRPAVGLNKFTWDGKGLDGKQVEKGTYSFSVQASAGTKSIPTTTFVIGKVTGVGVTGTDSTLILDGGSAVKFSDLTRVQ